MAIGSVVMWIGVPVGLIYLASRLADSSKPSMGPYVLILVGLVVGMMAVGKLLGALDRYHGRVTGLDDGKPQQAAWMKSMRGDRERKRRRSVLDSVMMISVGVALLLFGIWFFAFAGSSLPGA
jgi:multisubunit Na+/H+ antiporter MnhB subunit